MTDKPRILVVIQHHKHEPYDPDGLWDACIFLPDDGPPLAFGAIMGGVVKAAPATLEAWKELVVAWVAAMNAKLGLHLEIEVVVGECRANHNQDDPPGCRFRPRGESARAVPRAAWKGVVDHTTAKPG